MSTNQKVIHIIQEHFLSELLIRFLNTEISTMQK